MLEFSWNFLGKKILVFIVNIDVFATIIGYVMCFFHCFFDMFYKIFLGKKIPRKFQKPLFLQQL